MREHQTYPWPKGILYGIGFGSFARSIIIVVTALTYYDHTFVDVLILISPNLFTLALAIYAIYLLIKARPHATRWAKTYIYLALLGITPIMVLSMLVQLYVTAIFYLILFILHIAVLISIYRNQAKCGGK